MQPRSTQVTEFVGGMAADDRWHLRLLDAASFLPLLHVLRAANLPIFDDRSLCSRPLGVAVLA